MWPNQTFQMFQMMTIQWKMNSNIKSEICQELLLGSSPNFKLKLMWPNQNLQMFQMKMTSNRRWPQKSNCNNPVTYIEGYSLAINLIPYGEANAFHSVKVTFISTCLRCCRLRSVFGFELIYSTFCMNSYFITTHRRIKKYQCGDFYLKKAN